ncbi:DUF2491 family protein [Kordiimonas sp. SCSIO 12603]|uniref:DUF2491 family protein n=1 Tax=Kordiimonas sp. SCSIO 12603 TaxID=2829596 RepID=UPI002104B3DF|nr:DUF2491 family protein [Kordiimonas sp. SCSIO 12603]UTW59633.1 DUF2491 family protein [Kordiimonas sp. SCSIO 12603]
MGLFDFFKNKKDEMKEPVLPVIHDISFGRTVVIDPLAISLLGADHRMKLSTPSLTITGQGTVPFEDGVWLHRFYTDNHELLQIMGGDGKHDFGVQQISLFSVYDSIEPANEAALEAEIAKLKADTYTLDGVEYKRVWFDGDGPTEPVQFHETVYLDEGGAENYGIQQQCMLFGREVDGQEESLLVTHEKTDQGDESVTLMVGAVLSPNDISI